MAGTAPPPDGPSPAQAQDANAAASFQPGPPIAQLCGFKIPSFKPSFSFKLPGLSFPPKGLSFNISLGLNCSATNPLDVAGSLPWGGGRVGTGDPDPDDVVAQQTSQAST